MTDAAADRPRRSIEIEYWVVDETGRLTDPDPLVDAAPGVEREFVEPVVEVKTEPCASTADLRTQLYDRLGRVLDAADRAGRRLVPLATPLYGDSIADRASERTRIQDRVVGDEFECVRHCAGTHIHVEQLPGREIDQLNVLTAIDPALALLNSAPYFQGTRLAAGARSELYRWRAYDSLPHQGELWRYATDTDAWATRLQRRYEEFVTEAILVGFDRAEVEAQFTPESAVWTPVKLRAEFGTVEWRSPDTALPSQVLELADQLGALVDRIDDADVRIEAGPGGVTDDAIVVPPFETVRGHVQAAVRTGLSSSALRSYLSRMGFDVSAFDPLTAEFDAETVSPARARELRLTYADRLEREVRTATPVSAD
jgi:gamma-glutamyl:cysteine ligase YbdK (ATP-grasp superfamily)